MIENKPHSTDRRAARKKKIRKEIREWIISFAIALLAVVLIRTFLFTLIRVDGESMYPTLQDGERLFVTVFDARFGDTERGDVIICRYPNRGRTYFVKRAVAVPGDSIYRENGVTHVVYTVEMSSGPRIIDMELDPESASFPDGPDYEPYVLKENEYFVVGDNRYASHDSRDWIGCDSDYAVGPITRDMIVGHVRRVVWPLVGFRAVQ